ncbi:spermatogenesis associated glutamate (E)-rich protein 4-like isoform X2 [Mus musculus]|uniref:spermatogenesis associated glutamate (E)-rich protein 4-like isoform X2 n=1 Tax=Mus musculus TaxID=10090 RepID=UPI0003D71690|nr:spermatogenesis associated glutamate (E)-rich protein 4-like isoform X2 [Mus musculus]|eukprot:XP_006503662.1 PREDICTED: spermatogenesis associated glutamate (E)-rich protein 4-like isoform X2 [Mus musculus]
MALFARLCRLFQRANVDGRDTREGRKDADLPSERNEGRRRWTWRMWMALRQTSSPVPVISKKQFEKEEKKLIKEIQLTTEETNELRDRLIYVTEGSMNKSNLHSRLLMEENLIKKKSMTLQQESKEVQADWAIIHQRLVELNLSVKDEQENSNLETPEYQVSEAARELGLATAEEDSILQNELPGQEAPAEHHLQHPQSSSDESSSI